MYESGYYAPGTEFDSNAPWNEAESPIELISATVSNTLSKDVKIVNEDSNLIKSFEESYYSVSEILSNLINVVKDININGLTDRNLKILNNLTHHCEGWVEDEIEVVTD